MADPLQELRCAALNVAVKLLEGAPATVEQVEPLCKFLAAWISPTVDLSAVAPAAPSVQRKTADTIEGARPVRNHPNMAVIDGDKAD